MKLDDFLHAIKINWMHRYIALGYKDFCTTILDDLLAVNPLSRKSIIEASPDLNLLYTKFVTAPESGDNRFIFL